MVRRIVDILHPATGAVIALGSVGHSVANAPRLRAALDGARIDPGFARTLVAVWHFAGASMAVLGLLVLADWWRSRAGARGSRRATVATGIFYAGFAAWALAWTGDPFWWLFAVLGACALLCGLAPRRARG